MTLVYNGLVNAYNASLPLRETVNTAARWLITFGVVRIGASIASALSGDPMIDSLAQVAEAWAPFAGSAVALRYAYTSPSPFVRGLVAPVSLGIAGLTFGTGIENTPVSAAGPLDDILLSAQKIASSPTRLNGMTGSQVLGTGAGGLALLYNLYNAFRRR